MLKNFTALYMKLEHGYMGKILEWPGVITEGNDLEDCEEMLTDAAHEMMLGYKDEGLKIPNTSIIVKPISIPIDEEMLENAG
ncbi:MAG: type II toxin-antitoxin system HicB family antitoxin [Synergistales bacterium]|nr:type II toxin-antitoxin system HicB family antitoxin [Synergistales bacterium]MDY6400835.1 type II toxin-antitoxin system HicB family antitoxin [Synergistales bacterium]MDY6405457.1 type II toxin-antitoxin system HicB family antitoxin [Synergistales bacterium]MDY6410490.1 type II toxin-antitoxin system HicB family antitoxin [Synergistales bacterium]MDY6414628.1 type II toxin-antitoxin system HicB family antitoxin [Synergistales bacterium]